MVELVAFGILVDGVVPGSEGVVDGRSLFLGFLRFECRLVACGLFFYGIGFGDLLGRVFLLLGVVLSLNRGFGGWMVELVASGLFLFARRNSWFE